MRISAAFPSTYIKSSDLNGQRVRVVMSHVAVEKVGDDQKPILYFQGKQKGLVLNKTNATNISISYGDDTDAWIGQPIELFEAMVEFQGKTTPAIRVNVPRLPNQPTIQQQMASQAPPAYVAQAPRNGNGHHANQSPVGQMIDDEVPF